MPRTIILKANLPHNGDAHLSVVLALRSNPDDPSRTEWVTWLHNEQDHGYHYGHYFPMGENSNAEIEARRDFAKRVKDFMDNYLDQTDPETHIESKE